MNLSTYETKISLSKTRIKKKFLRELVRTFQYEISKSHKILNYS